MSSSNSLNPNRALKRPKSRKAPDNTNKIARIQLEVVLRQDGSDAGILLQHNQSTSHGAEDSPPKVLSNPVALLRSLQNFTRRQPFIVAMYQPLCAESAATYMEGLRSIHDPNERFPSPEGSDELAVTTETLCIHLGFNSLADLRNPAGILTPLMTAWSDCTGPYTRFSAMRGAILSVDALGEPNPILYLEAILQACQRNNTRALVSILFGMPLAEPYMCTEAAAIQGLDQSVDRFFKKMADVLEKFNTQGVLDAFVIAPCSGVDYLSKHFTRKPLDISRNMDILTGFAVTEEQARLVIQKMFHPQQEMILPCLKNIQIVMFAGSSTETPSTQILYPFSSFRLLLQEVHRNRIDLWQLENNSLAVAPWALTALLDLVGELEVRYLRTAGFFMGLLHSPDGLHESSWPSPPASLDLDLKTLESIHQFLLNPYADFACVDQLVIIQLMRAVGLVDIFWRHPDKKLSVRIINDSVRVALQECASVIPKYATLHDAGNDDATVGTDKEVHTFLRQMASPLQRHTVTTAGHRKEIHLAQDVRKNLVKRAKSSEPGCSLPIWEVGVFGSLVPPHVSFEQDFLPLQIDLLSPPDTRPSTIDLPAAENLHLVCRKSGFELSLDLTSWIHDLYDRITDDNGMPVLGLIDQEKQRYEALFQMPWNGTRGTLNLGAPLQNADDIYVSLERPKLRRKPLGLYV
ncbi:hypothetical protein FB45DRAFT_1027676 [Roridomyces roridus]|uniref:Uncharacterized protein n=1 Tax=Roridomyces roridus TaxID=1738132 RepID=A0AAD7BTG2_9AGAR|nr:hypothetical protein FB45DRAFT_1027676 [Roridomyces roridus]